jgi:hypothetical protein
LQSMTRVKYKTEELKVGDLLSLEIKGREFERLLVASITDRVITAIVLIIRDFQSLKPGDLTYLSTDDQLGQTTNWRKLV